LQTLATDNIPGEAAAFAGNLLTNARRLRTGQIQCERRDISGFAQLQKTFVNPIFTTAA